jgi:hypothetical protein
MERCYYGPFGKAPRHLPFRRAAMSFMRWQLGVACCNQRLLIVPGVRGGVR